MNDRPYERDFLIVVVIYETELDESLTLQRLLKIRKTAPAFFPDILVYDNSSQNKDKEKHLEHMAYYKHDSNNSGVGGAYNYAFELARSLNKNWLILFDQDTNVNDNYFKQLKISINKFPDQKFFSVTVRSNKRIVSPTYYFAERSFVYSKPKTGLLKSRFYTVINSGLAIHLQQLEELGGYDKDLPLDFSDHYLFWKYKKTNKYFVVIDNENLHNLSGEADETYDIVYKRFKKYYFSAIVYSKKVGNHFSLIWLFVRTLKLTLKFFQLDFFKVFFTQKKE